MYDTFQKGDLSETSPAFKLFDSVNKKTSVYSDYKEFLADLRNAKYIFSPLFESGARDLDKDYKALLNYNLRDFEDESEPESRDNLKIELKSFLLSFEYIYQDGKFTQKWYDACAVVRDRGFDVKNDRGRHVDPFPSSRNLSSMQIRKILKRKYYKTVKGLSVKQLIVHLSEFLTSMGFGLKI